MPVSDGGWIETFLVMQGPTFSMIASVFSDDLNGYKGAKVLQTRGWY
jgi:hypothetical protein